MAETGVQTRDGSNAEKEAAERAGGEGGGGGGMKVRINSLEEARAEIEQQTELLAKLAAEGSLSEISECKSRIIQACRLVADPQLIESSDKEESIETKSKAGESDQAEEEDILNRFERFFTLKNSNRLVEAILEAKEIAILCENNTGANKHISSYSEINGLITDCQVRLIQLGSRGLLQLDQTAKVSSIELELSKRKLVGLFDQAAEKPDCKLAKFKEALLNRILEAHRRLLEEHKKDGQIGFGEQGEKVSGYICSEEAIRDLENVIASLKCAPKQSEKEWLDKCRASVAIILEEWNRIRPDATDYYLEEARLDFNEGLYIDAAIRFLKYQSYCSFQKLDLSEAHAFYNLLGPKINAIKSPYKWLQLEPGVSQDEIDASYLRLYRSLKRTKELSSLLQCETDSHFEYMRSSMMINLNRAHGQVGILEKTKEKQKSTISSIIHSLKLFLFKI